MLDENDQVAVIRGLRDGDPKAWTALYDAYCADVWRYVGRLVGPQSADVADAVQETFLAAARSARQFDADRGSLWGWLAGIAHNQVANYWRRDGRSSQIRDLAKSGAIELQKWLASGESPDVLCEKQELVDLVRCTLSELSPDHAALLTAKYLDGQTQDELARRHNSTVEAVKSKLARARREFRAQFELRSSESRPLVRD